ncbi:hypothetical protein Pcinc_025223 [Petrolisthes cinctipes]|uniref:Uncharacterized protein n=1 Tax=Petrolisthes cinctipes TaxID=88211 RepID=A0AAE1KBV8_PETCI|nr:hypothetical protein Pcinc_025223 [Petrolisthes cinctipes]
MDDHPHCRLLWTAVCVVCSGLLTTLLSPAGSHPHLQDGPFHRLYDQRASSPPGRPYLPLSWMAFFASWMAFFASWTALFASWMAFYTSQRTAILAPLRMVDLPHRRGYLTHS